MDPTDGISGLPDLSALSIDGGKDPMAEVTRIFKNRALKIQKHTNAVKRAEQKASKEAEVLKKSEAYALKKAEAAALKAEAAALKEAKPSETKLAMVAAMARLKGINVELKTHPEDDNTSLYEEKIKNLKTLLTFLHQSFAEKYGDKMEGNLENESQIFKWMNENFLNDMLHPSKTETPLERSEVYERHYLQLLIQSH